ncbi:uncharacterized protein ACMZJ9_009882 [Mantella aurantiaca]
MKPWRAPFFIALSWIGACILCAPWIHYCIVAYHGAVLILSNICGSLLIYNFLLPFSLSGTVLPLTYPIDRPKRAPGGTKKGSPQAALLVLFLVTLLELLAVYWYVSGMMTVVALVAQSFCTVLYAVLSPSSSKSSGLLNTADNEEQHEPTPECHLVSLQP